MHFLLGVLDITEVLKYASSIGLGTGLMIILFGGYRKWWVFGWIYKESETRALKVEKERDDWRDLALRGTGLVEQTVDLFKRSRPE